MKRKGTGPDGLVIVDKPAGITSHTVVSRIRRLAGTRKVGHAGTLDPMATGVLVIGCERATRLLGHLALTSKTYEATIRLGQATVTDDAEGEVTATASTAGVAPEAVAAGIAALTGDILQTPSKVSAIKVDGKRSYSRVRDGEEVELAARPVTVSRFEVHRRREALAEDGTPLIDLDVTVDCTSGTYIRALARDLGDGLGVGGHLTALRRTRVGPYTVAGAHTLEALETGFADAVLPIADAAAAAFPRWDVDAEQARLLVNGVRIAAPGLDATDPIAVFDPDGRFLALIEEHQGKARSLAVFV
ncbi:tRNA pseudouridine(55) synthase TruB [Streptacidiphilus sp. PB12-B1b]|uniref:tRNA pseudouridine(55) synthase TruB n=1 Tax=Streptacidiphilus sp. PB12-B1b TaxID=2705012 RepID=UPI0015F7C569|nr:tRNA pseudouridine(55) synthase TruB [Streptacidiphilus sp. PB12-B1b]QMU78818.1 tRNA pseudouridine(55) synthase TruB [Streptacidiphilus sp. PB12-B1b]